MTRSFRNLDIAKKGMGVSPMPGCFSGFDKGGRVGKSGSFTDSEISHGKTFRIERVNHDIFKLAAKVRKTAVSIPILMKRKEAELLLGKICISSRVHFMDDLDIFEIIRTLPRSSRHFTYRPSGYSSDNMDGGGG